MVDLNLDLSDEALAKLILEDALRELLNALGQLKDELILYSETLRLFTVPPG